MLHVISKAADMVNQYREAKFCGWIVDNFPHYYATRNYSFVLKHVPYNILIVLFFEVGSNLVYHLLYFISSWVTVGIIGRSVFFVMGIFVCQID